MSLYRNTYWSENDVQRHGDVETKCIVINNTDAKEQ